MHDTRECKELRIIKIARDKRLRRSNISNKKLLKLSTEKLQAGSEHILTYTEKMCS